MIVFDGPLEIVIRSNLIAEIDMEFFLVPTCMSARPRG